jgi:hypothetical protein
MLRDGGEQSHNSRTLTKAAEKHGIINNTIYLHLILEDSEADEVKSNITEWNIRISVVIYTIYGYLAYMNVRFRVRSDQASMPTSMTELELSEFNKQRRRRAKESIQCWYHCTHHQIILTSLAVMDYYTAIY